MMPLSKNMNPARPVTLVAIVTALTIFGDAMLYVVLPIYWKEVGLTALWQVGVLLSINRFVRLPLNPFIGWLYNKMSLRTGLLAAVLLGAFTTVGYGIWKGFAAWLVLRSLWGIAWSLMRIGGYLTVINYSDDTNRGYLMGKYNGLWRLGSMVGVLFGGVLTPVFGFEFMSIFFGILAFIGVPLILISISSKAKKYGSSNIPSAQESKGIWSKPVTKMIICGLLISLLHAIFGSTLSLVIDLNHSGTVWLFGILITSTALGGILQAVRCAWEPFLATWFGHRSDGPRGRLPLFILSLVGAAAGYALMPWHMPIYAWIAIVIFIMVTMTVTSTLMDAMATDVARQSSVIAVMTVYSVSTDLGAAIGPTLTFWVIDAQYGMQAIFIGSAAAFLLIGLWYRRELLEQMHTAMLKIYK
ncbi:MFS transporter [Paenibacillus mendelii]|uniref:MFS transporter n=1 Tax=Paenibacillus mendelii TaxID=206163 RepID=A0ABV6J8U8_9BACL|nr:MFS transporter [Paenibacillus mendelii]MCQ6560006.1 MFS transporter [Paenibacillus mendelii]